MSKKSDLTGLRFGRLTAVSCVGYDPKIHGTVWKFACDCGNEKITSTNQVVSGKTKSCGCLNAELIKKRYLTHGCSVETDPFKIKLYRTWCNMRRRCFDPRNRAFVKYGGRGITVCKRWMEFKHFLSDMGLPPSLGHSIDRVDNDGGYTPKNCRWKTAAQQNRNYSRNIVLEYRGKKQSLREWVDELGLSYPKIHQRISKLGWSAERAFELA